VNGGAAALDFAGTLAGASPALMLAIFIVALLRRWLVLPRELDQRDQRIAELEKERDEFKTMALRALNVGERVVSVAEDRGPR
jgi:cell division protein FtsL